MDALLATAVSHDRLSALAAEHVPELWPGSEFASLHGVSGTYRPNKCVLSGRIGRRDSTGSVQSMAVFTFLALDSFRAKDGNPLASGWKPFDEGFVYRIEAFPADYLLPGLAAAHDPSYVRDLIESNGLLEGTPGTLDIDVLRYRPHERCVVQYTLGGDTATPKRYVAKVYDGPSVAAEVWRTLEMLRRDPDGRSLVIEPLAIDRDAALVLMPFVEGESLGKRMESTTDEADMRALTAIAAECLARLHALPFEHKRSKDFRSELAKLRPHANSLMIPSPELGAMLHATLDAVDAETPGRLDGSTVGFLHGGFKPTQLILHGGALTVLDFDGSCLGDPAIDVGRFMAKLRADAFDPERAHLRELDAYFLEQYLARGSDVARRARLYQALTLVRMACRRFETRFRSFSRGQLDRSFDLLREANACLNASR